METTNDSALLQDGLVGIQEACRFLAVSRSKLYELMDQRELPFVKIGSARRIPRRALVEFAAAHLS